jgi:hypothetical protein
MAVPRQTAFLSFCSLALLCGCSVVPGGKAPPDPPPDRVLKDLLRYADQVALLTTVATREFEQRAATPVAAIQGAEWRLEFMRLSSQYAASASTLEALFDLSLLVTLAGWMQEDQWIPAVYGEAARPMQVAMAHLAQEGFQLLQRNCDKKQVADWREVLRLWREQNPQLTRMSLLKLPTFATLMEQLPAASSSSLLGVVGLDPLACLEPTAREIERSREVAERALFFIERAPRLLTLEIEMGLLRARGSEEVRQALSDLDRVTATLESFAVTAASLPADISKEREAAVRQVSEVLAQQRAGLLNDLTTASAPLGSVLQQTQGALTAGERMSAELTGTVRAVDAFVGKLGGPAKTAAEAAAVPPAAPAQPAPPAKPFDINEYGAAVERVGVTANQLTALINTLDERLPEVQRVLDETTARGERAISHATTQLLVAGLILIAAAALAVLLVRYFSARRRA